MHAGLARTAANLHKEGMDTIEDYLQTLKKDLQDFFQKAGQSHNEDLVKKLDTFLKKAFEKLKSDLEASLVTCTTTIQGDFNALKKNQSLFGSAMADKFQEVLKEMAKNYDNVQKVCKETRDLVRWQQSQLEALQGRTDHLPDRLCILRDTLNDTQQLVLDVKGLAEDLRGQMEDKSQQERADRPRGHMLDGNLTPSRPRWPRHRGFQPCSTSMNSCRCWWGVSDVSGVSGLPLPPPRRLLAQKPAQLSVISMHRVHTYYRCLPRSSLACIHRVNPPRFTYLALVLSFALPAGSGKPASLSASLCCSVDRA